MNHAITHFCPFLELESKMKCMYIATKFLTWINILKQRQQIHGTLKYLHKCLLDEFMKIYPVHSSIWDNLLLD